jgi:hypothetical protein
MTSTWHESKAFLSNNYVTSGASVSVDADYFREREPPSQSPD